MTYFQGHALLERMKRMDLDVREDEVGCSPFDYDQVWARQLLMDLAE